MKKDKGIFRQFSQEDSNFVEKIIDICYQVESFNAFRVTPFLNPRQVGIVQRIGEYFDLQTFSSCDVTETEYSRLIIAPSYYQLDIDDFDIEILEIRYNQKFFELSHAQILGTLINQLGIQRELVGDIIVSEKLTAVCIEKRFVSLIETNIERVAKTPVKWRRLGLVTIGATSKQEESKSRLVLSSLRLDRIVASSFSLSRASAVDLIESGQVKVDYAVVTRVSQKIEVQQLISVRGFGRIRLLELLGRTKQDKFQVSVNVIRR